MPVMAMRLMRMIESLRSGNARFVIEFSPLLSIE